MTRSRTTERKRERKRERRRRQVITIGAVVGAVVLLLAIFLLIRSQPAEAPIPEQTATRYDGLAQGRTVEGYPLLGSRDAPLQVAWYCNFDSLDCAAFHDAAIDRLVAWARDGSIALSFVPLYSQTGNSRGAALSAVCAAQQSAFWPLHDALFLWRQNYGEVQAFTDNRIATGIDALGIDRGAFYACLGSGTPGETLFAANQNVTGLPNFTTTPAVAVNGAILVDEATSAQLATADSILAALERRIAELSRLPDATAEPTADGEPASDDALEPTDAPAADEAAPDAEPTSEATAET